MCLCVVQYGTRRHKDSIWPASFFFYSPSSSPALTSAAAAASTPRHARRFSESSRSSDVSQSRIAYFSQYFKTVIALFEND